MPKTLIPITEKHLADGQRGAARLCALALAINARLNDGFFVSVGTEDFWIFSSECKKVYESRKYKSITRLIDEFESGRARPTEIVAQIPKEFLK